VKSIKDAVTVDDNELADWYHRLSAVIQHHNSEPIQETLATLNDKPHD